MKKMIGFAVLLMPCFAFANVTSVNGQTGSVDIFGASIKALKNVSSASNAIAVGDASATSSSTAYGANATASASGSTAIGRSATVPSGADNGVAVGRYASVTGVNQVAVGNRAVVTSSGNGAVQIGNGTLSDSNVSLQFGAFPFLDLMGTILSDRLPAGLVKSVNGISPDTNGNVTIQIASDVTSVNGKTGAVKLTAGDVSAVSTQMESDEPQIISTPFWTASGISPDDGSVRLQGNNENAYIEMINGSARLKINAWGIVESGWEWSGRGVENYIFMSGEENSIARKKDIPAVPAWALANDPPATGVTSVNGISPGANGNVVIRDFIATQWPGEQDITSGFGSITFNANTYLSPGVGFRLQSPSNTHIDITEWGIYESAAGNYGFRPSDGGDQIARKKDIPAVPAWALANDPPAAGVTSVNGQTGVVTLSIPDSSNFITKEGNGYHLQTIFGDLILRTPEVGGVEILSDNLNSPGPSIRISNTINASYLLPDSLSYHLEEFYELKPGTENQIARIKDLNSAIDNASILLQTEEMVTNAVAALSVAVEEVYVKKADAIPRGFVYEEVMHPSNVSEIALRHGCIHVVRGCGSQRITLSIDESEVPEGTTFDALVMIEVGDVPPGVRYPEGCVYGFGLKPRLEMKGIWYIGFGKVGGKIRVGASGPFLDAVDDDDDDFY